jgi:hypothetical protein
MDRVGAARGVAALNAGAIWSETEGDVAQLQPRINRRSTAHDPEAATRLASEGNGAFSLLKRVIPKYSYFHPEFSKSTLF